MTPSPSLSMKLEYTSDNAKSKICSTVICSGSSSSSVMLPSFGVLSSSVVLTVLPSVSVANEISDQFSIVVPWKVGSIVKVISTVSEPPAAIYGIALMISASVPLIVQSASAKDKPDGILSVTSTS